jgi:hypothetical protein
VAVVLRTKSVADKMGVKTIAVSRPIRKSLFKEILQDCLRIAEMAHVFDEGSHDPAASVARKKRRRRSVHAALLIPPGGEKHKGEVQSD